MTFDGMMVHAICDEIQPLLANGRITKIYQPHERDLVFHIRAHRKKHRLLISANPTHPRIHLTHKQVENPREAPMFCMLLRKHFEGGIIENISQVETERSIHMNVRAKDELGDTVAKRIVIELMGRHSNIIVIDPQREIILDSIHHVSQAINQHRAVLPGRMYVHPPAQNKLNPFHVNEETVIKKINFNQGKLDRQIVQTFSGISPLLAQEMVWQAGLPDRESLARSFMSIMHKIKQKQFQPALMQVGGKEYFYLFPLAHVSAHKQDGEVHTFSTLSELVEAFFHGKAERDRRKQRAHDLIRFIGNEKKKNEKKIGKLEITIKESEKAEQYQLYGELLTAYMHQVQRGDKEVQVQNYYDENGGTISIPLDPQLTPNENAQRYFKKYNKTKTSKGEAEKQIQIAKKEIDYFERLLQQLEQATDQDLQEIREELIEGGYVKARPTQRKKKKKNQSPQLQTFYSSEGIPILVGKNNTQNEYLTNRLANANDTWLHTKDIPGSHVVIRSQQYTERTLLEAARIAAYFSKAQHSSQVPVDYTLIKHVRKPNGAKPGYVIYDNQQTMFVTPNKDEIEERKQK